ncbi:MAG: BMC domain-containing protein [Treponema sp.]|jgi:microcompartment protein CcmL/EutN|nr:BMC domain-containing protein [Treponema sp.]
MNEAIGFVELSSIAKGIEAADAILKTAETRLIFAKETCPGKYNILFCGAVAAVTASAEAVKRLCGHYVMDSTVIPRLAPQVIPAINQCSPPREVNALGVLEFYTITRAVYAADAAVKAADVELLNVRLATGIGGKSFVVFTGDVAAVSAAAAEGAREAEADGAVVAVTVIPNPRREIFETLL